MPFSPLPKTFLEDLQRHRHGLIVELGSGDGAFTQLLHQAGCSPLTIDRRPMGSAAEGPTIIADALRPSLRPASVDLLVAANLLRHLWPLPAEAALPGAWFDLLKPTASLYILEDEPGAEPVSAQLYRDLQNFLARLLPESRRPLLPLATFQSRLESRGDEGAHGTAGGLSSGNWTFGTLVNRWPVSRDSVLSWLQRPDAHRDGEAARLAAAIAEEGLSYGSYWWARWTRPAAL